MPARTRKYSPSAEKRAVYVAWRDASFALTEMLAADAGLIDLYELGWLVKADDESVTISIERDEDGIEIRHSLTVPRVNIQEMHVVPEKDLLRWMRRRARRKAS